MNKERKQTRVAPIERPVRFGTAYLMLTMTAVAVILAILLQLRIPGAFGHALTGGIVLAAAGLGHNAIKQLFNITGKLVAVTILPAVLGGFLVAVLAQIIGAGSSVGWATLAGAGIGCAAGIFLGFIRSQPI